MGRDGWFIIPIDGRFHVIAFVDCFWDYRGSTGDLATAERLLAERVRLIRGNPVLAIQTRNEVPKEMMEHV